MSISRISPNSLSAFPVVLPKEEKKGWFDIFKKYFSSSQGHTDFLSSVYNTSQFAQYLPCLKFSTKEKISRIGFGAQTVNDALSWLELPNRFYKFQQKITHFKCTLNRSAQRSKTDEKLTASFKKIILSGLSLFGTGATAIGVLDGIKLIDLGRLGSILNGAVFGATAIIDSCHAIGQVSKLDEKQREILKEKSLEKLDLLKKEESLSYLKIAKDVVSVVYAILSLASLFLTATLIGISAVPVVLLVLSTSYLVMNIASYFFNQNLKNERKFFNSSLAFGSS